MLVDHPNATLEMTPWAAAARNCSQGREPCATTWWAGEPHAQLPASHGSSPRENNAGTPVLTAIENAAACLKRSNLISWVFVNHLHLGSISKCILYIKTHKKLLQSYFLLAHYKIFVSNLHAPTSNDPTEDTSLKCDPLLVLVCNCPPLPTKGLKKIIIKNYIYMFGQVGIWGSLTL